MENIEALFAQIKLLLQQELKPIQDSINKIQNELIEIRGHAINRAEFDSCLQREQNKRESLEVQIIELDKEIVGLKASMKIYIAVASFIASLGSALLVLFISKTL